jgi:hypothetical protein
LSELYAGHLGYDHPNGISDLIDGWLTIDRLTTVSHLTRIADLQQVVRAYKTPSRLIVPERSRPWWRVSRRHCGKQDSRLLYGGSRSEQLGFQGHSRHPNWLALRIIVLCTCGKNTCDSLIRKDQIRDRRCQNFVLPEFCLLFKDQRSSSYADRPARGSLPMKLEPCRRSALNPKRRRPSLMRTGFLIVDSTNLLGYKVTTMTGIA